MLALRHRGPDGDGRESMGAGGRKVVHFGHRRLAVIDIEGGRQPMLTADGVAAITFNGEIYNFRRLRDRLESEGCTFRTHSDTEVLLHAVAKWGEDALPLLDGMFAFAAYDARGSRLLLAVDRFGQKPLVFFLTAARQLVFASEITALRQHPAFPGRVAPLALCRMLAFGQPPGAETIWRDVFRVEPGAAVLLSLGPDGSVTHQRSFRYWKPEEYLSGPRRVLGEDQLIEILEQSVADHLVADVPLGILLSGGVDSTVVAALAARRRSVLTMCLGTDQPGYDETALARRTARQLGTDHREFRLTAGSVPAALESVIRHLDEPLADAGCLPAWDLFREARGLVTVAVGGDGGDELLEGYPTFEALRLSRWLGPLGRLSPLLALGADWIPVSEGYYPLGFRVRRFVAGLAARPEFRLQAYIGCCSPGLLAETVRPELLQQAGLDPGDGEFAERLYEPAFPVAARPILSSLGVSDLAVYSHLRSFLGESVLRKVDRMSMAHGLEVRAPMLGVPFSEACLGLPSKRRRTGSVGKRPLRRWLGTSSLTHVLGKPKKGFAIPVARWLRDPLRPLGDELFLSDGSPLREWCRRDRIARLWRQHVDGSCDSRKELWALLTLGLWTWHHVVGTQEPPSEC